MTSAADGPVDTDSEKDAPRVGASTFFPLRRRDKNGELYKRDPKIEALTVELSALPRDELFARARSAKRSEVGYVPSECLLYFIRATRHDPDDAWFERLFKILLERVLRSLPRPGNADGQTDSITLEAVRDKALGRFVELLAADRAGDLDKLDFFEVRFDGAMANLRRDAQKQVWLHANRSTPLETSDEGGELSPEVEAAAAHDPLISSRYDDPSYRTRLDAAIDALPAAQSRVVHMLRQGFPIDSQEPDVMSIRKVLNLSEKTVRNYRDRAFVALRAALAEGDEP